MASRGFTLIEVLVAVLLLTMGMAGLAAVAAQLTRHLGQARRSTLVAAVAASRLERLRAEACEVRTDGSETVDHAGAPIARLAWSWTAVGDSTYHVQLVTTSAVAFARPLVRRDTLVLVVACRR